MISLNGDTISKQYSVHYSSNAASYNNIGIFLGVLGGLYLRGDMSNAPIDAVIGLTIIQTLVDILHLSNHQVISIKEINDSTDALNVEPIYNEINGHNSLEIL